MSDKVDPMDLTEDLDGLCESMDNLMDLSDIDDLPTAIIVTNVIAEVFSDSVAKAGFEKLFLDLDADATFVYLRNFKRVRIQFSSADAAGIARIKNDGVDVCGQAIRCYFFQIRTVPTDDRHLKLPERTKMFLISPPASPPVGWEPAPESEPIINYDLLQAIANLQPGEAHELHPPSVEAPAIVVHLCEDPVGFTPGLLAKQKIVQTRRPEPSPSHTAQQAHHSKSQKSSNKPQDQPNKGKKVKVQLQDKRKKSVEKKTSESDSEEDDLKDETTDENSTTDSSRKKQPAKKV